MKKSIVYIVNPISGTQRKRRVAELALELTDREVFEEPRLLQTEHAGHAEELAGLYRQDTNMDMKKAMMWQYR